MKIAVVSGKGGTGKTTIAVALAQTLGRRARLLDCDVEEPNCHLFFHRDADSVTPVKVVVPDFHPEKCNGGGKCAKVCNFNAIAAWGKRIMFFPELCHSCGACLLACPRGALTEGELEIGRIEQRDLGSLELYTGVMKVGSAFTVPLIRRVKEYAADGKVNIIDAPPGLACPMVTAVRACDYALLVTEPTPFGLHDLAAAAETVRNMNIPRGVILNRAEAGAELIDDFCRREKLDLLLRLPLSRQIAAGYSRGRTLLETVPELEKQFAALLKELGAL